MLHFIIVSAIAIIAVIAIAATPIGARILYGLFCTIVVGAVGGVFALIIYIVIMASAHS